MAAYKLKSRERRRVAELDILLKDWVDPAKDGTFKLDEVYIEEYSYYNGEEFKPNTNCHGMTRKFKVVHISPAGVAYLKELNIHGVPSGELRLPHRLHIVSRYGSDEQTSGWHWSDKSRRLRWTLDPGHLDSILLDQEFNPTAEAKENSQLFSDINAHNKRVTVDTRKSKSVRAFLQTLKPGDTFWTSPVKHYVVQSRFVDPVGFLSLIVLDHNLTTQTLTAGDLVHKRVYRERPRSFTKESKI